jgi:hypothetical protein
LAAAASWARREAVMVEFAVELEQPIHRCRSHCDHGVITATL